MPDVLAPEIVTDPDWSQVLGVAVPKVSLAEAVPVLAFAPMISGNPALDPQLIISQVLVGYTGVPLPDGIHLTVMMSVKLPVSVKV